MKAEEKLSQILRQKKQTVAVAESVTGGLISHLITKVPGCSNFFLGAVVAYSNSLKEKFLNVSHETLRTYGAVSEETAKEMAEGIRILTRSNYGLATTGIAGPTGGTNNKPIGLVYIAVSALGITKVKQYVFTGDRLAIQEQAAKEALIYLIAFINDG